MATQLAIFCILTFVIQLFNRLKWFGDKRVTLIGFIDLPFYPPLAAWVIY
jgi:hypothetical protein